MVQHHAGSDRDVGTAKVVFLSACYLNHRASTIPTITHNKWQAEAGILLHKKGYADLRFAVTSRAFSVYL
jgi:hypothetical protein